MRQVFYLKIKKEKLEDPILLHECAVLSKNMPQ